MKHPKVQPEIKFRNPIYHPNIGMDTGLVVIPEEYNRTLANIVE